ncbi:MAG: nucleotide sugar dehydrogenase [Terriglobia bacterium]|nr:nucleotide sugar dehydrogenase [Terriglobia bacterium]
MQERIAVVGLGYVGLPVALAFAKTFPNSVGFDISKERVDGLRRGHDWTGETASEELTSSPILFSADEESLKGKSIYVVCVPTPIDNERRPDLRPLVSASQTVGRAISSGAVVVFESTVYPGATEEICGPIIERISGLKRGVDFKLGYSPERINPGDRDHTLQTIVKVVAGEDEESTRRLANAYGAIVTAGIHVAPTIKVAEAAKVIENTQRDLNIALMNELAVVFERLDICTLDVLKAAGTKWNFLPFRPGLVGGHCIGVDPYYLTAKAEAEGYRPEVILSGRRINDGMGAFIANKLVRMLVGVNEPLNKLKIGILGLTFKENVRDLRNSRVPDIVSELKQFGINAFVHDPLADPQHAREEYGVELCDLERFHDLHGLIFAVPHAELLAAPHRLIAMLQPRGVLVDVKSALSPEDLPGINYWSL